MSNISRARALELETANTNILHAVNWTMLIDAIPAACFYIRFTNSSSNIVYISYNPDIAIHDLVLPDNYIEIYFQNNASYSQKTNNLAKGTPVYIRGTPSGGLFAMSCYTYVE